MSQREGVEQASQRILTPLSRFASLSAISIV